MILAVLFATPSGLNRTSVVSQKIHLARQKVELQFR